MIINGSRIAAIHLKIVKLFGIVFLIVQGISELFKSYWAATKGKWPGEEE